MRATAEFAPVTGVSFVAGHDRVVRPRTHRLLAGGRPVPGRNDKAGDDPARHSRRWDELLDAGATPRALCLNDSAGSCRSRPDCWTRPGWPVVPRAARPVAEPPAFAGSTVRICLVLEFPG